MQLHFLKVINIILLTKINRPSRSQCTVKPQIFATILFSLISRVQKFMKMKSSENISLLSKYKHRPLYLNALSKLQNQEINLFCKNISNDVGLLLEMEQTCKDFAC